MRLRVAGRVDEMHRLRARWLEAGAAHACVPAGAAIGGTFRAVAEYMFELYVAGDGMRSRTAVETLRAMCDERLAGRYDLVVIDVLVDPERAERAKILATPTLLRRQPVPDVRIIGDLTLTRSVLAKLEVPQESAKPKRDERPPT